MTDVIEFHTALPMKNDVVALAESHRLFWKTRKQRTRGFPTSLYILTYGPEGQRLVTLVIKEARDGSLALFKFSANLPALLHGHNGRLIATPQDYHLALSRLASVIEPLLAPDGVGRLFSDGRNDSPTCLSGIEIPLQFPDPGHELLLGSHLTSLKRFQKPPILTPGESTTLRSSKLDIKFYDKRKELANKLKTKFHGPSFPCSRIEMCFRNPTRLLNALGVPDHDYWYIQTLPFDHLFLAYRSVARESMTGALAPPGEGPWKAPRGAAGDILQLKDNPVLLHTAIVDYKARTSSSQSSKIRCTVFESLARLSRISLAEKLENPGPEGGLMDVCVPAVERRFAELIQGLGWSDDPDPSIISAFSELRLMKNIFSSDTDA